MFIWENIYHVSLRANKYTKEKEGDEFPRMDYVEHFGKTLDSLVDKHPNRSRGLLKFGWGLMNLKFKALPDRRLCSADRYLAHVMMDTMLSPLKKPDQAVAISVFVPCELLQEVKLNSYNVESFPTIFPHRVFRGLVSNLLKRTVSLKRFVAIIKRLLGLPSAVLCRGQNVSYTPT